MKREGGGDRPAGDSPGGDRPEPMDQANRQERNDNRPGNDVTPGGGGGGPGGGNAEVKTINFPKLKDAAQKEIERWERKLKANLD